MIVVENTSEMTTKEIIEHINYLQDKSNDYFRALKGVKCEIKDKNLDDIREAVKRDPREVVHELFAAYEKAVKEYNDFMNSKWIETI